MEAEPLRRALGDAVRVARGIPGLQRDANEGAGPLSGRLKVRIAGHTITYRGALAVTEDTSAPEPAFTITGEATEARGGGAVELTVRVRLLAEADGTRLVYSGTGKGEGRVAELDAAAVETAVRRLLSRFSENLAGAVAEEVAGGVSGDVADDVAEPAPDARTDADRDLLDTPPPHEETHEETDEVTQDVSPEEPVDVPPSVPDPFHQDAGDESFIAPPAEAAHARRTMIGRSAEEVDHAPPRGRYAPVPAPQSSTAGDTLRWAAPAAAVVVASAIVVSRVLRRRK
ncbi:SRPBCC domain-containing protein [Streptomyces boluensis]|nr:SRPBCC domain-containing protein [Streptomyces boluensis]